MLPEIGQPTYLAAATPEVRQAVAAPKPPVARHALLREPSPLQQLPAVLGPRLNHIYGLEIITRLAGYFSRRIIKDDDAFDWITMTLHATKVFDI